jgi:hypothetical protein
MKPWADPNHPSYQGIQNKRCLGCGKACHYSAWGPWCHPCNVTRMTRINKSMAALARSIGDEEAARELEEG